MLTNFGGLYAQKDGRPLNLQVVEGAHATTTTIYVNQETDTTTYPGGSTAKLDASSFTLTVGDKGGVGSGTSLHIVGFDSNTTLAVTDSKGNTSPYRLTNLDNDIDTFELLACNENWTYYSSELTTGNLGIDNADAVASGTWIYKSVPDDDGNYIRFSLDSDAGFYGSLGKDGSSTGIAKADAEGGVVGVTVEGNTIRFDNNHLNINRKPQDTKTNVVDVFDHIKFDSNTAIGAEGIHIAGFASGTTTFKLGSSEVYLAELDGDTTNGLEIIKKNDNWTRTANGWYYLDSDTTNGKYLGFNVNTTLDVDDNTGAPIGISVTAGTQRLSSTPIRSSLPTATFCRAWLSSTTRQQQDPQRAFTSASKVMQPTFLGRVETSRSSSAIQKPVRARIT